MGWVFCDKWTTKNLVVQYLKSSNRFEGQLIKSTMVGNHHWYIVENNQERYIGLDVLKCERGVYGYKDMCESMSPFHYDCPLGYFNLVPKVPNEFAVEWREKVKKHHANKKEIRGRQYAVGDVYLYGNNKYRLSTLATSGKKWIVESLTNGMRYSMSITRLNQAMPVR